MKLVQFVIDNKEVIIPTLAFVYSEFLSLNPKYKSNGVVQVIGNIINKLKEGVKK